jgi:hypothetical protein
MTFYNQKYVERMKKNKLKKKLTHTYDQTAVNEVRESEKYTDMDRFNRIIIN